MTPMLTPRVAAFAFIPLVAVSMSAVISLTLTLLHGGLTEGFGAVWLRAWGSAFAVALPAAWLLVPAIRHLLTRLTRPQIVPPEGVKIP